MSEFWHWPDHVIGKRESRRLREEHNARMYERAELLETLEAVSRLDYLNEHNVLAGMVKKAIVTARKATP